MGRSRWPILWAVALIVGGGLLLVQNLGLFGQFQAPIWTFIFGVFGLLFLLDAITTRGEDWWALIPGCILLGVAGVILLGTLEVRGEWIGSLMLFSIALPFLLIYLIRRQYWWALIPGGILLVIAVIPLLAAGAPGELVGTLVLWVIAIPFLVVFLNNRRNWWALIPGGVLLVVGLMALLSTLRLPGQIIGGIFFLGLAAVFGLIWLLHRGDREMVWAIYPAGVLLAVGLGVIAFGQNWWPLVLIVLGVAILIWTVRPRPRL